ncbi:EF hand protein [Schistosoma japonicum]|uniref:EF hand protein n=1 Tax=Schistosoma japonicum TaxID=6182 RepID=A0A4Z2CPN0_SCHJA|nr:EF hand protein [Schistosoma japonicum]TNN06207.1 EF hand protein [Schistosoma japonicum]
MNILNSIAKFILIQKAAMNNFFSKSMSITEIGEIFGKLDKNHNGLVSQKELKAFLKHNSVKYENKEIREFVAKIDDNNDGQISMDEMIKALSGNLDVSKASQLMPR